MDEHALASALVDLSRAATRDLSLDELLRYAAARVLDATAVSGVGMVVDVGDDGPLHVTTDDRSADLLCLELELGQGPCLAAYRTGLEVTVPNMGADRRFPRFAARATDLGAAYGIPLRVDVETLGALVLYSPNAEALLPVGRWRVRTLADVLAAHVFNARTRMQSGDIVDILRDRALHDPVTGAPNRWLLRDRLDHAVDRSRRGGRAAGVLFIDVDHMKSINDHYGHATGDTFLRLLVHRISGVLRPEDTLARLAGDEFVVICEDLTGVTQAEEVADRVLSALAEPFGLNGSAGMVTSVSIGVALVGHEPDAGDEALARADAAMYRVKRAGGAARRTAEPPPALLEPYAVPDVG